ncbi:MAG: 2-amino-4-hydroxy-6-hydroxymethyldihydropteridine diphosphokinase [Candidatus Omnitrophica bacterium]|nr:2-amino-4-hydroxy-6-hydroxymethyldihydropteridine diphosphokinase [Candidatus Omnitrophota bacterium]
MVICYLGIGSNLGDRKKYINTAIEELRKNKHIHVNRISSIYETEALSAIAQGKFLNGVLEIETDLTPEALLGELNAIEGRLGRKRIVKDGPRTIDLDILYYDDVNMKSHNLIIPHPKIREREFVLKGLRELGKA